MSIPRKRHEDIRADQQHHGQPSGLCHLIHNYLQASLIQPPDIIKPGCFQGRICSPDLAVDIPAARFSFFVRQTWDAAL